MSDDPTNPVAYARAHLIEQIMAIKGRSAADPVAFRRLMEGLPLQKLSQYLAELEETLC